MGYDHGMPKRIAVAFLGTLLLASSGFAQTPAEKEKEAKDHYEQGIVQYNLTNYQEAIDHFKKAYELTKAPALLFNIAQAYRLKKDYSIAKTFYQNYVREQSNVNSNDPNIKEAENFIQEMEKQMQATGGTLTPVNPPPVEPPPVKPNGNASSEHKVTSTPPIVEPAPPEPDEPSRPGRTMKLAGLGLGIGGVILGGVSAFYAFKTEDYEDETSMMCTDQTCLKDREGTGKLYQGLAWGLGAAGVAAIGTGVVLYYLGSSKEAASSTAMTIAPTLGGGAFVLSGRF